MAKDLLGSMPKRAQWAPIGFLFATLYWSALASIFLVIGFDEGMDIFRASMIGFFFFLIGGSLTAMILLVKGFKAGRIVAWIVVPFLLLNMPIGTLMGVAVLVGLLNPEMREHLHRGEKVN